MEPEGEPAKVVRRRALEDQRAEKRAKRDTRAAAVMVGFNSLRAMADDALSSGVSSSSGEEMSDYLGYSDVDMKRQSATDK